MRRNEYGLKPGDLVYDSRHRSFGLVVFTRPATFGEPGQIGVSVARFSIIINNVLRTINNVSDYKVVQT